MGDVIKYYLFEEKVPGCVPSGVADALARMTAELEDLAEDFERQAVSGLNLHSIRSAAKKRAVLLRDQTMSQVAGAIYQQVEKVIGGIERLGWEVAFGQGGHPILFSEGGVIGEVDRAYVWLEGTSEEPVLKLDLWTANKEKRLVRNIDGFSSLDEAIDYAITNEGALRDELNEALSGDAELKKGLRR